MQIYLLRHGIADDPRPGMDDSQRALTSEGKKGLRAVLKLAKNAKVAPDLIISSPYRRAVETAEIAAEELGYKESLFKTKVLQPGSAPQEVWDEIRLHKDCACVLLAGHEPCLGRAAGHLLGVPNLLIHVKKASLIRIDVEQFSAHPRGVLKWMAVPKLAP